MESKHLYLKNWPYNAALIIDELHTIIEENGGTVKQQEQITITNRTIDANIRETTERLETLEAIEAEHPSGNENRTHAIKAHRADLEKLQRIDNSPRTVRNTTWSSSYISFKLDGIYYYYQTDDNPFFDFYYHKTPIAQDGTISKDAYLEQDRKEWLYDCFLRADATDADRREAANIIYNMLIKAPVNAIHREKRRIRVPNTYASGYHYETVYERERREKLNF